ncbi:MAG TPA: DUF1015 domain-containing protein [Candidatus Lustribacter sp.]|nr:DUF1015 domain-containing protein [Candidatus Lustribacter sp.]
MPRFEPFPALRYAPGVDLAAVTAPPYDVLSGADVDALQDRDPRNITHVDVPRGGSSRYDVAGHLLRQWMSTGVLVADAAPSLTVYRMRFTDATGARRELVGVLGAVEVVDEGAGGVLPHERTTPKASTDRLDLTRATEANLSPVWGLSLAHGLSALLQEPGEPVGSVTAGGVEHVVERVADPGRTALICARIGSDDVLIADGHHRYGVGRHYRDEVRARSGRHDTPAELTLTYVAELTPDQLNIDAIHRVYRGVSHADLRAALGRSFDLSPAPAPTPDLLVAMARLGRLVLVGPSGPAEWLVPKAGVLQDVRALDGAWLEHALRGSAAEVSYQHGLPGVLDAVGSGAAAVLIRPVSITEIERTAREGLLMPPKSTFFTPKPLTGLVVRDLREGPSQS